MRKTLFALALLGARGWGQTASPAPVLERVVVVGASGSAGFGIEKNLADALDATISAAHEPVRCIANTLFFVDVLGQGPMQIERAREAKPTLLVAVDFLFWFGYGFSNAEEKPLASEEERLALLEQGLALLEGFSCPVVVGDFPDCSRSIGKMLFESQVPEPATLAALNARLAGWAESRRNVVILPLARSVERLFAAGNAGTATDGSAALEIAGWAYPAGAAELLFQPDQLHPTLEGLALIAHLVARELVLRDLVEAEDVLLEREGVLEGLREVPAKR